MKKKFLLSSLAIVLLVSLIILPVGCAADPSKAIKALETSVAALQKDVKALKADTGEPSGLSDRLDSLEIYLEDLEEQVGGIDISPEELSDIWEAMDSLQEDIAEIEVGGGNGSTTNGANGDEEYISTRWTIDAEFDPFLDSSKYSMDVDWYPTRIKEEDTYKFTIDVTAIGAQPELEVDALWLSFNPTSRDTSIDIGNTGIYSISPIGIWWDSEYSPSDGVDCRSMVFVSDDFGIPALADGITFTIRFDFDLYYK